jgi:predicted amidohydrolase/mannitol/fructose-specific phosphotransferase system IIA component (Ntr-type)/GNAT superfamily N-acetyltransferase
VPPLDLSSFERQTRVRTLRPEDWPSIDALQKRCFPGMEVTTKEQFLSQLDHFPAGQLGVEHQGQLVATASSLILDFELYKAWSDWEEIADGGFIRNHREGGTTLYGIELMVDPDLRGKGLARRLYDARKALARERNLMRIVVAGRMPGFAALAGSMSPRQYVEKVLSGELSDPVLSVQLANGFVLKRIIPGYIADPQSGGFAAFLEWTNLDYQPDPARRYVPAAPVRVCVVQWQLQPVRSFDDFAERMAHHAAVASEYRCDFLLFPELFTSELLSLLPGKTGAQAIRALDQFTPRFLELGIQLAVRHDVNIIGGSHLTIEDGDLYNIAYLFRRDGTLGKQYKLHVTPSERVNWGVRPGERLEVLETDRGKICIQICYDVEFPELSRIAVEAGARILFVPFCTDERYAYLRVRYCAQARAVENQVYVAMAGLVGHLPRTSELGLQYAQSAIVTPSDIPFVRDAVAGEATPNIETVIFEDLDLELLRQQRQSGTVLNWTDRRRDLYQLQYTPVVRPTRSGGGPLRLSDLLGPENVSLELESTEVRGALRELASLMFGEGTEFGAQALAALEAREALSSTAVGQGVAIPHARIPGITQLRLALGVSAPGIDFRAADGGRVHVLAAVVSPQDGARQHLAVLARLATLLRDDEARGRLVQAVDPQELISTLAKEDLRLEEEHARRKGAPLRREEGSARPVGAP